ELLRTLLAIRWRPGHVRALMPRVAADQPAVVLFTSGSEKAPKAVPLTHHNLLSCLRSGMSVMGVTAGDVLLAFLPLLTGVRVVDHPDPTDAVNLVHKIEAYGVTVLVATPTFIHYILERAT